MIQRKKEKKITFSVIIPVRTFNEFLKENISYLKEMDFDDYEVLIITDLPERYKFGSRKFKVIPSGVTGPGEKRNLGAKKAGGEVLAFLDDDAYPSKDWLVKAKKIFQDKKVYAMGAPALTPVDSDILEKASGHVLGSWLSGAGAVQRYIQSNRTIIADYPTVNFFVRKEAFEAVGGFTNEFWPGEDTKFCLDLVKKYKRKFLYDPLPIVYHRRRKLFLPHLKQVSRYGMHRGQFAKIFPETSRVFSYFVPSLFVIGLAFGPLVATIVPILSKVYFFVISLYLILLTIEGCRVYIKDESAMLAVYTCLGIFLTHIVYGISFMVGLIKKPGLKLRAVDAKTGNYLGG